jgi:hypothetical protein
MVLQAALAAVVDSLLVLVVLEQQIKVMLDRLLLVAIVQLTS